MRVMKLRIVSASGSLDDGCASALLRNIRPRMVKNTDNTDFMIRPVILTICFLATDGGQ